MQINDNDNDDITVHRSVVQLAANQVTMLRSTLADFYDELDRKLLSSARQTTRRPGSSKGQGQRLVSNFLPCVSQLSSHHRTLWTFTDLARSRELTSEVERGA